MNLATVNSIEDALFERLTEILFKLQTVSADELRAALLQFTVNAATENMLISSN